MAIETCSPYLLFFGLVGLLIACQPKKKAASLDVAGPAPVAALAQPSYALGDSIDLALTRPATHVVVYLGGRSMPVSQPSAGRVIFRADTTQVGLYALVIQGREADNTPFSDTLSVTLRSNTVPAERHYTILKTYPHQTSSFTEGLEFYRGDLYESTGLNGQSRLLKLNVQTGLPLQSDSLLAQYFGEGITIVKDKIYQLTWTSGLCFRYNLDFTPDKTFVYHTQGWGLTHFDTTLVMSDGTNKLYFFTPDFQKIGEVAVYDNKGPVANLNELEYVDGYVFANVWQTNRIVQIDPATGRVVACLNMERIVPPGIDPKENVLNGIAYEPTEKALYVTGKNWPTLVKIRLEKLSRINQPGRVL